MNNTPAGGRSSEAIMDIITMAIKAQVNNVSLLFHKERTQNILFILSTGSKTTQDCR
jgi:hypothetical protein